MATSISWTNETWNPLVGCSRISAGCKNCYAADAAKSVRLQQFSQYQKVKDWDGTIEFVENQLLKPLSWRSPKKVFVCSMSDIFHANVKDEWLEKIFAVMALSPQHTFQVLTKRPERMLNYLTEDFRAAAIASTAYEIKPTKQISITLPLPNVWLGTSVENQKAADDRIPSLLQIPAAIRFLSCEPLLGPIDLRKYLGICVGCQSCDFQGGHRIRKSMLDWGIVGGESGTDARACETNWIKSIVYQYKKAKTAVFVKQLGSNPTNAARLKFKTSDRKGGNIDDFPPELRVREFPKISQ